VDAFTPVELIGYLASALIVLSLLMASVLKLRVINLAGATVFTVYGVLIGSWPVILTNAAIVVIDVYYLVVMLRDRARRGYFEVVGVPTDSPILRRFVAFHLDDIRRFQPSFAGVGDGDHAWMVLRDAIPVGVVVGERAGEDDERLRLHADYVTPEHRDFTAGSVLFGGSGSFHEVGTTLVESLGETDAHRRYLSRMGFERDGERWTRGVEGAAADAVEGPGAEAVEGAGADATGSRRRA
jgi:hypothetical protein